MNDQELIDKLESVWSSMDQLCRGFSEKEWKTPTDCPGWSVQDHISHIVGTESWLLGRPMPDHKPRDMSHVKNEVGARNEVAVDWAWWVVVLLGTSLVGLGYLRHFARIRSLTGRRDRLLEELEA